MITTPTQARRHRLLELASAVRLAELADDGRLTVRLNPPGPYHGGHRDHLRLVVNGRPIARTELVHWEARGWITRTSQSHHPAMRRAMYRLTAAGRRAVEQIPERTKTDEEARNA